VRLDQAKERAEAIFKRKEKQVTEGAQAWVEYQAKLRAIEEKTERFRALRLSKEG
jgi:predicted Zn-dependent protease